MRTSSILILCLLAFFWVESAWAAPSIGIPDAYATFEDTTLTVVAPGLKENDYHPDGLDFFVSNFFPPSHGTLISILTNGAFEYQPDPGYIGSDAFTYILADEDGVFSEQVTVTIEVLPDPNRAPIGVPDFYSTPQDTTLTVVAPGLKGNDVELDGDDFNVSNFLPPSHGTLTSIVTNGAFEYQPDPGYIGFDSFTYTLLDEDGVYSETVTVTIEINPSGGGAPIGTLDAYATFEDTALTVVAPGLKENDYHPDGLDFFVSNFLPPSDGNLITIVTNGAFEYQPDPDYIGPDSFTYTLVDEDGVYSEPVTVNIEVLPDPNRAPIGVPDFYSTAQDTTLTVVAPGLKGNDVEPDGDDFFVSNFFPPSHGTLTSIVTNGAFTYQPDSGYNGLDSFTYTLLDEEGAFSESVRVSIFVGQPQLTVTKTVINDDGGDMTSGEFPLFVDAMPVISGVRTGFTLGDYVVSETPDPNYTATIGGIDCDADGSVSLALGDDKSCIITNDDNPPTLELRKVVINNEGGTLTESDFVINLSGGSYTGTEPFHHNDTPAIRGTVKYRVSEDPSPGYQLESIECTGASESTGGTFTAVSGDAVVCTVTNNDLGLAYFLTQKDFSDNNPASVTARISCNTGLLLTQGSEIAESDPVNFVMTEYTIGTLDCVVRELDDHAGYKTSYTASITRGASGAVRSESDGCYFDQVIGGQFDCLIENELLPVTLAVSKEWTVGDPGLPFELEAIARWECNDVRDDAYDLNPGYVDGELHFEGASDTEVISGLYPDYDGSTYCTVEETWAPSEAESDATECAEVTLIPGNGSSCTIYNTVFFEGIPTLNRYGFALLALLMLAVGVVGFRRYS